MAGWEVTLRDRPLVPAAAFVVSGVEGEAAEVVFAGRREGVVLNAQLNHVGFSQMSRCGVRNTPPDPMSRPAKNVKERCARTRLLVDFLTSDGGKR